MKHPASTRIALGTLLTAAMLIVAGSAFATDDWTGLDAKKRTQSGLYMTAQQAYDHTMANMEKTLFLDIRTPEELNYLGAATVMDAHIPFEFLDTSKWNDKKHHYGKKPNPDFVALVDARLQQKGLGKSDTVILMCRSGNRSAKAADALTAAGYTHAYTVVDGYEGDKAKEGADKGKRTVNGWRNSGLPWTYTLDRDQMYFTK